MKRKIGAFLFVILVAAAVAGATMSRGHGPAHAYVPQTGDAGEARELFAANQDLARRTGVARPGAYAAALRQKARMSTAAGSSSWKPYGKGPLIGDKAGYSRVENSGHADLAGRINHFAYDSKTGRIFATAGQGGVWLLEKGTTTWRSIGDNLPTQAAGGIGVANGALVVLTGNDVFGGGTTFAGLGAYRSTDLGKTWTKAKGIPDGVNGFQIAVDPSNLNIVYAATGAGLFRSTDAGKTFTNVKLPVSPAGSVPNCTGAAPTVEGCFLANMVTDVVVRAPGGVGANTKGGAVIAAVGWRAGNKTNKSRLYPSYVESPGNGLYTSANGQPGSFTKVDNPFDTNTSTGPIGRIELGSAVGPQQNHDYLYAIVQDATYFQGGSEVAGIDVPGGPVATGKYNTTLKGIYSSSDFGKTWTLMANATTLLNPNSGSSLTVGLACGQLYCPGVQSWYNAWIEPDPTRADANGVPTRLLFGLEEIWENTLSANDVPAEGPTDFHVIASYTGGTGCLFLILSFPACPTAAGYGGTTLHPDQHDGMFVPDGQGGVTLYAGNDGGAARQHVAAGEAFSNHNWGRGLNDGMGFNTLMPYQAVMAKDGVAYAGLQDNGELRTEASGTTIMTHDGDGTWSAVDPDNSDIVYERQPQDDIQVSSDGGKTWSATGAHSDTFQFVNPFAMDPASSSHLLDAGNLVWETTDGGGEWTQVFDLGSSPAGVAYAMSALDVRSERYGPPLPTGPHTANFSYTDGATTVPAGQSGTVDIPGTYADHPFTIGPNDGDASVDVKITWADPTLDWDLYLYRKASDGSLTLVKSSGSFNAETGVAAEEVVVPDPKAADYVIRVVNSSAARTFDATVTFTQRTATIPSQLRSSAYVAFCGTCDALNARPFDNGIATNVGGSVEGAPLSSDGWHRASARGLPKRFITSIISDPANPKTVYVTLAGYSRRWLPVGVMGELPDPGKGNVFKSTDAGETFTNISYNLPDGPAESVLLYNGKLIVGTDTGVYISNGTKYQLLGSGLPNVPVFSLALKPKASPTAPDVLYAGTHGRGIYTYQLS